VAQPESKYFAHRFCPRFVSFGAGKQNTMPAAGTCPSLPRFPPGYRDMTASADIQEAAIKEVIKERIYP
jgi:hypothetical protein